MHSPHACSANARLVAGCDIEALDATRAKATGTVAAKAGVSDIVDAAVVEGAIRRHGLIVSSDPRDLLAIAASLGQHLELIIHDGLLPSA